MRWVKENIMKWLILICSVIIISLALFNCKKNSDSSDREMTELDKSIEEFKNRKIYTRLDADTLSSISDDKLEQAIIDYISSKFNEDYSNEYQVVISLSPGLRALYSTWLVEAEVNNGGFNQFYWNSSGQFAKESEAGFLLLGALDHYELMKEANMIHEQEKEKMQKYKEKGTLSAFSDSYKETKLNSIDDKFFDLHENLSELRIKYIRSNMGEFISN